MYGLLIENLASFIRIQWGEGKWDSVRKHAGVDAPSFSIHHVYAETLLSRLAKSACTILGVDERQFFEAMGVYFVEFVGHYGYDKMLSVLGRHLRDFLNGLDNLHEYLKFSYTKMRAPSFYCDSESATGLRLHYRSKRRGFVWYTIGQIKQVAKHFYEQDIEIELVSEVLDGETMHNIFQLTFDNQAFVEHENLKSVMKKESQLPIRASIIFELFPFCIVFSTEMVITYTGHALLTILKDLVGQGMTEAFEIVRPLIAFSFQTILERSNNIFELITTSPIKEESLEAIIEDETVEGVHLKLRGQMLLMEEWDMIIFLANPVMPDLETLVGAGIFINDLSLHDCSRDLVLAGNQQSVELKLALDQEQHKSKKLEESMKKLDDEMKRTDELLYQMIPKQVADRLRKGENPVQTCEVFDQVSILFSDVVTFTDICSKITPIQVVGMLNHMYSLFDQLTERNGVYKVETIGDSYMVVSGAPVQEANHAVRICDMAMDMVDASKAIKDPTREGEHLKLRVGCHSGMVVAGVVGVKMPRYCLFGDTVNTSSRMESTSEANRIQISETCMGLLPPTYKHELRGTVTVKGKGEMKTYWLVGREARVPLSKMLAGSFDWGDPSAQTTQTRRYSKQSDKGSRKSSVISNPDPTETTKSRGEEGASANNSSPPATTPAPKPATVVPPSVKVEPAPSTSKDAGATQPPKVQPPPPKIIEPEPEKSKSASRERTPSSSRPATPLQSQKSTEDSSGNKMELNVAGKDLYKSGRRLSEAVRSRSPSPASRDAQSKSPNSNSKLQTQNSSEDSAGNKMELNPAGKDLYKTARRLSEALRSRSPSPTPGADRGRPTDTRRSPTSTTGERKASVLVRQVTVAELPDKLAEVMNNSADQVKIVKVPSKGTTLPGKAGELQKDGEDIICIVPVNATTGADDGDGNNNTEGGSDTGDQDRESFLINVKMKKGQQNGGQNGFKRTINGIRVGISRLPKNEALRKRIRENKISVVTADVLTDIGCVAFADKQKQVISQACSIL